MKKYVYSPFINNIHYDTDIQYNSLEEITELKLQLQVAVQ